MHRTTPVPLSFWWSCLLGVALLAGARPAHAQPEALPPPAQQGEPAARTETVPIGATRKIGMTTKAILEKVLSENPKVIRIQPVENDPTVVLVTGLGAGTTRVTLTDVNKKVEYVDVRVPDEWEQRRLDLLDMIHKTVPTAVVDVTAMPNTAILTGYVGNAETAQLIVETARGIFTIRDPQGKILAPAVVVNGLRIGGVQQVTLEVVVAVVNRSEARSMNFSWVFNGNRFFVNSILASPLNPANTLSTAANGATATLSGSPNFNFGILGDRTSFTGYLGALRTEGLAKILADSRVTTLSGRPAFLVSGGETPILTSSGQGAPSVTYKQFGTVVNFLPVVLGNGKIHLEVRPELSARSDANGISIPGVTPTIVPGFTTRSAQVAVQIEDGQTLAIGGLIQNTVNASITKVPVLGDIPFINTAFTAKTFTETEEELLILVTPRLVDPMTCTQIPKYLPGRETRSADDFELFLEGILEAPRGQRTVTLHPKAYQGAHMQGPVAGLYPCGDGNCGTGSCATGNGATGNCASGNCGNGNVGNGNGHAGFHGYPYPSLQPPVIGTQNPVNGKALPAATLPRTIGELPAVPVNRDRPATPGLPDASLPMNPMPSLDPRSTVTPAQFGPSVQEERY